MLRLGFRVISEKTDLEMKPWLFYHCRLTAGNLPAGADLKLV